MPIQTLNPTTGQIEKEFSALTPDQIEVALTQAHEAYLSWRETSLEDRTELMKHASEVLQKGKETYAEIMTREMGKPISQSVGEVEKCAWNCDHYAENAASYLNHTMIKTEVSQSFVQYDPMGVVLLVMPWNFPLWQVFRMAVPTIMAGNTVILKHASNVPQAALVCQEIFEQAGFPKGVFQTLLIGSSEVESIIRDKRVVGVSLTGSERAGKAVAAIAGSEMKPFVMELGGSDPFIVREDADIDLSCEQAKISRLLNGGQVCIAAKRFIVHRSRMEEFQQKLVSLFEGYTVGDPMKAETHMGPMVSSQGRDDIERQVQSSVDLGAKVLTGGKKIDGDGFFYLPTILSEVTPDMAVWKEETFGPVAALMSFETDEEAIALANDTEFGLGASLFTKDEEKMKEYIDRLETGMVFVNGFVKTDPRLPTGGVKSSGVGRELGEWGIKAFCNAKTVWIK